MSDNKKYYYLKLKDNFFDSDEMIILESMPDGYLYSNVLLKLYLRSLKNEGRLMFNERIPFNSTMLAQITRHSVGVIEKAMKIFQELNLIDILDTGAIYMLDIQTFIGKSSTEADRKREYRAKINAEKGGALPEGQTSDKCPDKPPPEIEIEIDKELDIEKEIKDRKKPDPTPYQEIVDLFNEICTKSPKILKTTDKRKKQIALRYKELGDINIFEQAFRMVQESKFLTGDNDRGWVVKFDWLMANDTNIVKVLEGNYKNNKTKSSNPFKDVLREILENEQARDTLCNDDDQDGLPKLLP